MELAPLSIRETVDIDGRFDQNFGTNVSYLGYRRIGHAVADFVRGIFDNIF